MIVETAKRVAGLFKGPEAPKPTMAALETSVAACRERLTSAKKDHEASQTKAAEVAQEFESARAAFDAEGSGDTVDRLMEVQRSVERERHFVQRTQRAVAVAEGELRAAEVARDAAVLAGLEARVSGALPAIEKLLKEEGIPTFQALNAFLLKAEAIIADAHNAQRQVSKLRGYSTEIAGAKLQGIGGMRSVLRARLKDSIPYEDRERLTRAID